MFSIDRRLPLLAAALAGLAMIGVTTWQGYRFWQAEQPPARAAAPAPGTSPQAEPRRIPRLDWQTVPLFGRQTDAGTQATVATENLPETNLRLSLRGVLAADGDFPGSALIEDDKGKTDVYLVGDELPGGARLRTVFPTRVVIERSGKLENLYFPDTEDRSGLSVATSDEPPRPAAQPQPAPSAAPATVPDSNRDQARREEIRRRLEQLRERLRNQN
jgi:general secretion pathway protein C